MNTTTSLTTQTPTPTTSTSTATATATTMMSKDDFENEGRKHVALVDDPACLRQVLRRRPPPPIAASNDGSGRNSAPAALYPKEIWIKMLVYKPQRSMRKCPSGKTNQERIFIMDDTVKVVANFDPRVYTGYVWFVVEKAKSKKSKLWKRRWAELVQSLHTPSERVVYERFDVLEHGEVRQSAKGHLSPAIAPHIFCNLVRLCQDGEVWFQADMFPSSKEAMTTAAASSTSSALSDRDVKVEMTSVTAAAAAVPTTQNSYRPIEMAAVTSAVAVGGKSVYPNIPHLSLTSSPVVAAPMTSVPSNIVKREIANPLLNAQVFAENDVDNEEDDEDDDDEEEEEDDVGENDDDDDDVSLNKLKGMNGLDSGYDANYDVNDMMEIGGFTLNGNNGSGENAYDTMVSYHVDPMTSSGAANIINPPVPMAPTFRSENTVYPRYDSVQSSLYPVPDYGIPSIRHYHHHHFQMPQQYQDEMSSFTPGDMWDDYVIQNNINNCGLFKPNVPETPYRSFIPLNPGAYFQEEKENPYHAFNGSTNDFF